MGGLVNFEATLLKVAKLALYKYLDRSDCSFFFCCADLYVGDGSSRFACFRGQSVPTPKSGSLMAKKRALPLVGRGFSYYCCFIVRRTSPTAIHKEHRE